MASRAEITHKAGALAAAAIELVNSYKSEGNYELAGQIDTLFGALSDESAARLYDFLTRRVSA